MNGSCMFLGCNQAISQQYYVGANAVSLYHFNGTEGSTSLVDELDTRDFTTSDTNVISADVLAFGGFAHRSYGTDTSRLVSDSSGDFYFGTDDFCIDVRIKAITSVHNTCYISIAALSAYTSASTFMIWNDNGKWMFDVCQNNRIRRDYISTVSVNTTDFFHFELSKTSDTVRYFINGIQVYSLTGQADVAWGSSANAPMVSLGGTHLNNHRTLCFIDELRVVKGTGGGHTSNFTPLTSAYTI